MTDIEPDRTQGRHPVGPRAFRALRWATALTLLTVAGFYWWEGFTLVPTVTYNMFPDLAGWLMITAVIATPLTSRLPRVARLAGVVLWFGATVALTVAGAVTGYANGLGDGDVNASFALWAEDGYEVPVPLPVLSLIALMFGAAVSGPPARSATIDAIFFWSPEPPSRRDRDNGARL